MLIVVLVDMFYLCVLRGAKVSNFLFYGLNTHKNISCQLFLGNLQAPL